MRLLFYVLALASIPVAAHAYVGPGAGLGAIALTIAVLLGLVLLLVGFLWFPLKRMVRTRRSLAKAENKDEAN